MRGRKEKEKFWNLLDVLPALKRVPERFSEKKFLPKKVHWPQPERTFLGAARTCDLLAPAEVHARQLCTVFKHLDVACGVAVTSTNGERSMRPRGREVE